MKTKRVIDACYDLLKATATHLDTDEWRVALSRCPGARAVVATRDAAQARLCLALECEHVAYLGSVPQMYGIYRWDRMLPAHTG